jgi:ligand-binding sensor domain-containing protein/two-component sensor histidine kinase
MLFPNSGFTQSVYRAETIKFNQGLPSDFVTSIIKKNGNLYIATQRGLCLYDGYQFIKNPKISSLVNSLAINKNDLYYDDHNLGLVSIPTIFDIPKVLAKTNFEDSSPYNDHYNTIYVDQKGLVWCTDQNNIKYYSPSSKKIISFPFDTSVLDSEIKNTFLEPNATEIWIATRKGVYVWNRKNNHLMPHSNPILKKEPIISAKLSQDKHYFIYTNENGSLFYFDLHQNTNTKKIDFHSKKGQHLIVTNFEDKVGNTLLYNEHQIKFFTAKSNFQLVFETKNKINYVFYDTDTKIIWVATNHGLVKLMQEDKSITTLRTQIKNDKTVTSIVQDDQGQLWMCNTTNTIYLCRENSWKTVNYPDESLQFSELFIKDNNLIASSNKGVYILKENNLKPLIKIDTGVKKAILDNSNQLWILPNKGSVLVYDFETSLPKENFVINPIQYWKQNQFNDITVAKNGTIWLASWMPKDFGISYFDNSKRKFAEINQLKAFKNEALFITDYYNKIAFTHNGNLLFSGYGGWNLVNPNGKILHSFNTQNYNVANDHIEGIAEDSKGNIWFASAEGLNHYNFQTNKVARISQIDGLTTDELIYGFCKLSGNKIALGTNYGCQIVDLDHILKTELINKLQITVVKKDGTILSHANNKINLDYDYTELDIYFSALSFSKNEKIIYRYQFDTDKKWNYLGTNPKLSLVKLASGDYKITVEVGDNLGNWQTKKLHIALTIQPPFYQTYGFMGGLILVLFTIIYFISCYFINLEKIKGILKSNIKEAEMQTLRSQMNPHFMFNSLNSINSYIIQNKSNEASKYLTTFSKLMRSILENSKHRTIPLEKEIKTLDWYIQLEAVRLEHKFSHIIHCSEEVDQETVQILPLIMQPFVENAIWHGIQNKIGQGHLNIQIDSDENQNLKISITDDGIGRKASKLLKKNKTSHKSYGIDITINRLQMLHPNNSVTITDLYDETEQPIGTRVLLTISY